MRVWFETAVLEYDLKSGSVGFVNGHYSYTEDDGPPHEDDAYERDKTVTGTGGTAWGTESCSDAGAVKTSVVETTEMASAHKMCAKTCHMKVYARPLSLQNRYSWVCGRCLHQGEDRDRPEYSDDSRYADLLMRAAEIQAQQERTCSCYYCGRQIRGVFPALQPVRCPACV